MRNILTTLIILVIILIPSTSLAIERQYRVIKLTDGRELHTEILKTVETGLEVQLPQGRTLLPFDLLIDMYPIDEVEFEKQDPALVWIRAPDHENIIREVYASTPKLEIAGEKQLGPDLYKQALACGNDFGCLDKAFESRPWMWIVTATPPLDDRKAELIFRSRTSRGNFIEINEAAHATPEEMWAAALKAIQLIPQGDMPEDLLWKLNGGGPKNIEPHPSAHPASPVSIMMPLPGYTFLRKGRTGAFAASIVGSIAISGGASVGLMASDIDPKVTGVISGASFYAMCLVTNGMGMKSGTRYTTISGFPSQGGASVSLSGRF